MAQANVNVVDRILPVVGMGCILAAVWLSLR